MLFDFGQKALGKLAVATLSLAYLGLAVCGNLILAGILLVLSPIFREHGGFSECFYFVWMTFHLRAYGEVTTTSKAGGIIRLIVVIIGSLCWVAPLSVVARRCVLEESNRLFSSGPGAGYQAMLTKVARSIVLPYSSCLIAIVILAGVYHAAADQESCDEMDQCIYGNDLRLLLETFHGASYGDRLPTSTGQRVVACVVASLGYLWRQIAVLLLLVGIDQKAVAKRYALALVVGFACFAIVGCPCLAAVNVASSLSSEPEKNFGISFYYIWMTYNGRAYGDVAPQGSAGKELVGFLAALTGNLGWVWPLLLVMRSSLLQSLSDSVRTAPQPDVIGALGPTSA